jgi:hypothetical protein
MSEHLFTINVMKVLKTLDFPVTTREALWTAVFASAIDAGFTVEMATEQTSRVVDLIFSQIGPKKEAELRLLNQSSRLRPRTLTEKPPRIQN